MLGRPKAVQEEDLDLPGPTLSCPMSEAQRGLTERKTKGGRFPDPPHFWNYSEQRLPGLLDPGPWGIRHEGQRQWGPFPSDWNVLNARMFPIQTHAQGNCRN